MNKKNKDIEVVVEEVKVPVGNQHVEGQKLKIGKREIGVIYSQGQKFIIEKDGKPFGTATGVDDAFQILLEDYNLNG
ncbi:MAG: DUF2969 domain-containing protein [Streptococcaceae bacterium]|jgi:pyoverdine/dityrosine biosynthesis protein Dit1|nr:DUF2969 domain-containing protein [Streptococcaceae bacterium]